MAKLATCENSRFCIPDISISDSRKRKVDRVFMALSPLPSRLSKHKEDDMDGPVQKRMSLAKQRPKIIGNEFESEGENENENEKGITSQLKENLDPSPLISLPISAIELIIENLDIEDALSLAMVSRNINNVVHKMLIQKEIGSANTYTNSIIEIEIEADAETTPKQISDDDESVAENLAYQLLHFREKVSIAEISQTTASLLLKCTSLATSNLLDTTTTIEGIRALKFKTQFYSSSLLLSSIELWGGNPDTTFHFVYCLCEDWFLNDRAPSAFLRIARFLTTSKAMDSAQIQQYMKLISLAYREALILHPSAEFVASVAVEFGHLYAESAGALSHFDTSHPQSQDQQDTYNFRKQVRDLIHMQLDLDLDLETSTSIAQDGQAGLLGSGINESQSQSQSQESESGFFSDPAWYTAFIIARSTVYKRAQSRALDAFDIDQIETIVARVCSIFFNDEESEGDHDHDIGVDAEMYSRWLCTPEYPYGNVAMAALSGSTSTGIDSQLSQSESHSHSHSQVSFASSSSSATKNANVDYWSDIYWAVFTGDSSASECVRIPALLLKRVRISCNWLLERGIIEPYPIAGCEIVRKLIQRISNNLNITIENSK